MHGEEQQGPAPALDVTEDQLQQALYMLSSIHSQIQVADDKIRALFGATAVLTAALTIVISAPPLAPDLPPSIVLAGLIVRAIFFGAAAFSVLASILTLLPRVRITTAERSLFFFGHIAATPHDASIEEFSHLSRGRALRQVLSQVHVNSLIVRNKYLWIGRASIAFIVAVVCLMLTLLLFA